MFKNVCRLETGAEFAFEWAVKNYCKPNDVLHLLHVQRTTDGVCTLSFDEHLSNSLPPIFVVFCFCVRLERNIV
jgi:hypothetical protein